MNKVNLGEKKFIHFLSHEVLNDVIHTDEYLKMFSNNFSAQNKILKLF